MLKRKCHASSTFSITLNLLNFQGSEDETSKYTVPVDLWEVKKLHETDFWFLKTGEEVELEPEEILDELIEEETRSEQVLILK